MAQNTHYNLLTQRLASEARIAQAIRGGNLFINDVRISEGRVWNARQERFRSEASTARHLRDGTVTVGEIFTSPNRYYNTLTRRFNDTDQAPTTYQNQILKRIQKLQGGENINVDMGRVRDKKKFVKGLVNKEGQTAIVMKTEDDAVYTMSDKFMDNILGLLEGSVEEYEADSDNIVYEIITGESMVNFERITPSNKGKRLTWKS